MASEVQPETTVPPTAHNPFPYGGGYYGGMMPMMGGINPFLIPPDPLPGAAMGPAYNPMFMPQVSLLDNKLV